MLNYSIRIGSKFEIDNMYTIYNHVDFRNCSDLVIEKPDAFPYAMYCFCVSDDMFIFYVCKIQNRLELVMSSLPWNGMYVHCCYKISFPVVFLSNDL